MKKYFFPHDHKPEHIKSLDGLRGFAVIVVLLAHVGIVGFDFFAYYGKVGVYTFFILSAYLLDRQIIEVFTGQKGNRSYWLNYCLRRFLRIFPLFFISLVFYYLLNRKYVGNSISNFSVIWDHLIFERSDWMYWSIPVEFRYYLVSPILLFIFHKMKWNLNAIYIILSLLIIGSVWTDALIDFAPNSTTRFLPAFLMGTLIAVLEKFKPEIMRSRFKKIGSISIFFLVLLIPNLVEYLFGIKKELRLHDKLLILPLSLFLGGLFLVVKNGFLKRIAENILLRFFGAISFSLYLFHMGVIFFLDKYGSDNIWINTFWFFFISIIISIGSYLFIEYPLSKVTIRSFMRKKKHLIIETVPIKKK